MNDLIAIIINEVPIAFFIDKPANKTNAGMMINPPPAPTIPVKIPTINPSKIKIILLLFIFFGELAFLLSLNILSFSF